MCGIINSNKIFLGKFWICLSGPTSGAVRGIQIEFQRMEGLCK